MALSNSQSPSAEPAATRSQLRARRRGLSKAAQRVAAAGLLKIVGGTLRFRRAKRIALYLPADGEIDPRPIAHLATQLGKSCFLPAVRAGHRLEFRHYDPSSTRLRLNRFGIPEPLPEHGRPLSPRDLDLALLPLVGFDIRGSRMGMGGGYYDRAFAGYPHWWRRPLLVGLAHDCQETTIKRTPWDVPVDAIATGTRLIVTRAGGLM